jgi:hypothetical protein
MVLMLVCKALKTASMKVGTVCHFLFHPNGAIGGGKDVSELSANIDVANTCIVCGLSIDEFPVDGKIFHRF